MLQLTYRKMEYMTHSWRCVMSFNCDVAIVPLFYGRFYCDVMMTKSANKCDMTFRPFVKGQLYHVRDFCHILTLLPPGVSVFHKHVLFHFILKWCEISQGRNLYKLSQKITLWVLLGSMHRKINQKISKCELPGRTFSMDFDGFHGEFSVWSIETSFHGRFPVFPQQTGE